MSGFDDYFPPLDDDEEENENPQALKPGQPPILTQTQEATSSTAGSATRSRADEILDAVTGNQHRRVVPTCGSCGSTNIVQRGGGMGGTVTRKCRDCRVEVPWATTRNRQVPLTNERVLSGPYTDSTAGPSNPNVPIFRRLSESEG